MIDNVRILNFESGPTKHAALDIVLQTLLPLYTLVGRMLIRSSASTLKMTLI